MTRGGGRQGVGDYKPQEIEAKWQKRWADHRVFETEAELGSTQEEEKSKPAPLNPKGAALGHHSIKLFSALWMRDPPIPVK